MTAPIDGARLRDAIAEVRRRIGPAGCDGNDHWSAVTAAAEAHLATLSRPVWMVWWNSSTGVAYSFRHDTEAAAEEDADNIRQQGGRLVHVTGPHEVPA